MMKTQKTEIQSASIARGIDKKSGETYFVVQSDSDKNTWHKITWSDKRLAWQCDGEKCAYSAGGTGCKHARAATESMNTRHAQVILATRPVVQGSLARPEGKSIQMNGHAVPMR